MNEYNHITSSSLLLSPHWNLLLSSLSRGPAPQTGQHLRHVRKLGLDVHLGLHLLHLLLGVWVLHHLGQDGDQQQRHHHHHQHRIEQHVSNLPLLPLLIVSELSKGLGLDGIRQLCHLKSRKLFD